MLESFILQQERVSGATNKALHAAQSNPLVAAASSKKLRKNLLKKVKKTIGVIGGSGPDAGVQITTTALKIHKERNQATYKNDTDAPNIVLMQHSGVGGPHGYWDMGDMGSAEYFNLWEEVTETIMKLEMIGAHCFCITCNTLHALEPEIRRWMKEMNLRIEFVSIIDSTQGEILRQQAESQNKATMQNFAEPFNALIRSGMKDDSAPARIGMLGSYFTTGVHEDSPYRNLVSGRSDELEFATIEKDERNRLQDLINETKRCGPLPELQDAFFNFVVENFLEDTLVTIPEDQEVHIECDEIEVARVDEIANEFGEEQDESNRNSCAVENENLVNPILASNKKARCDYLVLGCTELPLLLADDKRELLEETFSVTVIDPNYTLAQNLLSTCDYLDGSNGVVRSRCNSVGGIAHIEATAHATMPEAPKQVVKPSLLLDVNESQNVFDTAKRRNLEIETGSSFFNSGLPSYGTTTMNNATADTDTDNYLFGKATTTNPLGAFGTVAGFGGSPRGSRNVPSASPTGSFNMLTSSSGFGDANRAANASNGDLCGMTCGNNTIDTPHKMVDGDSTSFAPGADVSKTDSDIPLMVRNDSAPFGGNEKSNSGEKNAGTLSKSFMQSFYGLKKPSNTSCMDLGSTTAGGKSATYSLHSNHDSCTSLNSDCGKSATVEYENFEALRKRLREVEDDEDDAEWNDDGEHDEAAYELNEKIIYGRFNSSAEEETEDESEINRGGPRITRDGLYKEGGRLKSTKLSAEHLLSNLVKTGIVNHEQAVALLMAGDALKHISGCAKQVDEDSTSSTEAFSARLPKDSLEASMRRKVQL